MGAFLSELFPAVARACGTSFTFSAGRVVSMSSPYVIGWVAIGYGLGVGIGTTALFYLIGMVAVWLLPETRSGTADRERGRELAAKA
jgi:dipeptide/tripeptide permease